MRSAPTSTWTSTRTSITLEGIEPTPPPVGRRARVVRCARLRLGSGVLVTTGV